MDTSFRVSLAGSFARLHQIRARLTGLDAVRTMEPTESVQPHRQFTHAGVAEMVRVTCAFFIILGSAIAGLVFGNEPVRLMIAAGLLVGAWPLWVTVRSAIARSEFANALRYLAERLESARRS